MAIKIINAAMKKSNASIFFWTKQEQMCNTKEQTPKLRLMCRDTFAPSCFPLRVDRGCYKFPTV